MKNGIVLNSNNSLAESENYKISKILRNKIDTENNQNTNKYMQRTLKNNITKSKISDNNQSRIRNSKPNLLEKKIYKGNDFDKDNSRQFKSFKEGIKFYSFIKNDFDNR